MNYQTQQMVQSMVTLMTMGMFMGVPRVMFQTVSKDYEKEKKLIDLYGKWQVKRSEAVCPLNDWACIEAESSRLAGVLRARYW